MVEPPRQAPAPLVAPGLGAGRAIPVPPPPVRQSITLPAGTGRLVQLPSAAVSVIAAEPRIARVEPTSQTTLFVMGVSGGRTTVVFVTHSVAEAVTLADRVVVLAARPGRIVRVEPINLGRPRVEALEDSAAFHEHVANLRHALRQGHAA